MKDGLAVLDYGCGWGSLSLYLARNQANIKIVCISNSQTQIEQINQKAKEYGCSDRLLATVKDAATFDSLKEIEREMKLVGINQNKFDRIISIEMLEHMKN